MSTRTALRLRMAARIRAMRRVALSHYVLNGLAGALGLLLISTAVHLWLGALAAATATVGVIVAIPPDNVAPQRGKFWQMLPAPLLSMPLFFAVQLLYASPLALGLLLVPATFLVFLGMAWGKRGAPVAIAIMLATVFAMAVPVHQGGDALAAALSTTLYFGLGAVLYLPYALLINRLFNARYRVQLLADALLSVAALLRVQARQFAPIRPGSAPAPLTGQLLRQHAALAEQLQAARDVVLESPNTPRRQRLVGMLVQVLEMRDHLLACELDLDAVRAQPGQASALAGQRAVLQALTAEVARLADALLLGRRPTPFPSLRPRLVGAALPHETEGAGFTPSLLARGLAARIGHINDEVLSLIALARGEAEPDLAVVRANWQMFVSPTTWSWRPFAGLWRWEAPALRHAMRAALAIAAGYAVAQLLPWGTHPYWMLVTIVVVLRGSLAQTLERRNSRVAGTLLGCVLALGLLSAHLPPLALVIWITLAQGVAHGFAVRRYLVTAVAATTLGLLQAHMLNNGGSTAFALLERVADTLIGTGIAWAFSYVLPSWERTQLPALVARTLAAQAQHARVSLGLGQLQAVDNAPELAWRLARREAYDSLSALVQATQRSLAEPRAVRPPLAALEHLQARGYQLLAQLTAVKTLLLLRRGLLQAEQVQAPLEQAAERIGTLLLGKAPADAPEAGASPGPEPLPSPYESDLSAWLLRRLRLATELAALMRADADQVLASLVATVPDLPVAGAVDAEAPVVENQKT
ncbi:FUSC family protein [Acidovorax sp. SRB_14]|uniref:FUSC family protein n=2 Tax=unclassified Acidovorax TaxID=2684926 RepID=UPI001565A314|nr:FUSC family protein [Acidovorax sp. SRB_14]NMM82042.1 FUSC family protein [Acidovorax sp. SRB_14]